jgi:hypothetical protein
VGVELATLGSSTKEPNMPQEPMLIENKPHEEQAEHVHHSHAAPKWSGFAAVAAACFAALAALTSLMAGHHADHGILTQMEATNKWSYFQSKSVKGNLAESKVEILSALGKEPSSKDRENIERYAKEKEEIKSEAEKLERESQAHRSAHSKLANAIGLFQVAIAVCAVALLTKRQIFLHVGLALGATGLGFFVYALISGMH